MRLVVVLALCIATSALAQAPESSGVTITSDSESGSASVEHPTSYEFTVTHTGGLPPPFGQARQFYVFATSSMEGWTVSVDPASFRLGPGASQVVTVTVQPSTDAADKTTIEVVAQMGALGAPDVPMVSPLVDPPAEDNASLALQKDDDIARDLIERLGPGVWLAVLLLAFVAALVLAIRLGMSRRATIRLDAPERAMTVPPGGKARFRVLVENTSHEDDTVVFHVSEPSSGWSAFLPLPEMLVRQDHVEELQLTVIAPKEAKPGDRQVVEVSANATGSGRAAKLDFEVIIQ